MSSNFRLRVLAADRALYDGECSSLILPTIDGELEILAHHSNMIAALIPGVLRGTFEHEPPSTAAVSGGLIKVENNDVLVLVETAELPEEIDANRAKRAEAQAREAILQKKSIEEYRLAQANLARALNRLRVRKTYRRH